LSAWRVRRYLEQSRPRSCTPQLNSGALDDQSATPVSLRSAATCWLATLLFTSGCNRGHQRPPPRSSPPPIAVPHSRLIPPGTRQVPAAIARVRTPAQIALPDSARVGDSIPILITTYGGGCIWEDSTEIAAHELRADMRPYQRVPDGRGLVSCSAEIRVNERMAILTFGAPGLATIVVHGRVMEGDSVVSVSRSVRVH